MGRGERGVRAGDLLRAAADRAEAGRGGQDRGEAGVRGDGDRGGEGFGALRVEARGG